MKGLLTIVVIAALFVNSATAATYYVETTGSDAADGSIGTPWKTLTHAKNMVSAGDTVMVGAGLYDEDVKLDTTSGTAVNPITWIGQGYCRVRQFYLWSAAYNTITNFTIGEGHTGGFINDAVVDLEPGANGSKVLGCVIYSFVGENQVGLNIRANGCIADGCTFTNFSKAQIVQFSGNTNQVINCLFKDNPSAEAAFYIWGTSNRVANCTITNLNEVEVTGAHPDLFQSFFSASWGHIIENNLFINNTCQIGSLQAANGDYNGNTNAGGWIFRNNIFINCGSKLDVDFRDMQFLNNTFYNCNNATSEGHVINFNFSKFGIGTNGVVINNLFFLCGSDPTTSPSQGWFSVDEGTNTTHIIRNSMTISNNFVAGARFQSKDTNSLIGTNWINGGNPKFVYAPSSRLHRIQLQGTSLANNTTNIQGVGTSFTTELSPGDYIMLGPSWIYPWGRVVTILNDTNLWVDIPIGNGTSPKTGGPQSIRRSQNYDPMPDLRLLAGSLAIDAGADLALVPTDYNGTVRPVGTHTDIGAYEGATTEPIPTNMVLHLTFNNWGGGTNALDSTTNHADAVLFGGSTNYPTVGTGPDGSTAAHIADYQYFGITNVSALQNLTNGTVAVWAIRERTSGYSYILDCGFTFPCTNGWTLGNDNGQPTKLYVTGPDSIRNTVLTWADYQNTNWHHFAFTWTNSTCVGYFDGVPFQTNSLPSAVLTLNDANWMAVGCIQHNGTPQWGDDAYPNAAWLNGTVADVRMYNTAMSAADILNVYNVAAAPQLPHPPAPPPSGGSLPPQILMHLTFDGWGGYTNVLDITTNHADAFASDTNGPTLVSGPIGLNGAHFDYGQWLAVTNVNVFQYLTNGSVALWINFDTAVGVGDHFVMDGWYAWPETNCFYIGGQNGNATMFRQYATSTTHTDISFGNTGTFGSWHHYGATWNGTNVVAYRNGLPISTNAQLVPFLRVESTAGWLALGVQHGSYTWDSPAVGWLRGSLADVRIYNYTLTAAEFASLLVPTLSTGRGYIGTLRAGELRGMP